MSSEVTLQVNGKSYAGWKSARITRGIECLAGAFELAVSDRWAGQSEPWPVLEEDECTVKVGEATVITGYVDGRSISFGAEEHSLRVKGRDRAGMLVDCSAVLPHWEFRNLALLPLAQRLVQPFGIEVRLAFGLDQELPRPPAKFSVDPGEKVFDALDRACRLAGVLPVSDGMGGILLTRAGSRRADTAIIEGKNILVGSADYDATNRYRRYVVSGQQAGSDAVNGAAAASVRGEAEDATVRRSERVLLVRPEMGVTRESAKKRAQWEAKVRAARAQGVSVTVQGWTQPNGALWPVNALVPVRSKTLDIDGEMLISQAAHTIDESGSSTELTLRRPDAFIPEPVVQKPEKAASGRTNIVLAAIEGRA